MKSSAKKSSRFFSLKAAAPLLGTSLWVFAIWFEYVSMKSKVNLKMATMERMSPEQLDLIYRWEINLWIQRNYFTGAILVLWLVYLVWRWVRAFREFGQS